MPRKLEINPVTRVEGHGKVTIQLDDAGAVTQARLHIIEFRGFEKFVQGRPFWEMPVLSERMCGICPVSHHLAAAKTCDVLVSSSVPSAATKLRRLMHYGQVLQSHALHFFHLSAADFLLGFDSDPALRNVIGIAAVAPDTALKAIKLRKYGQEVIKATGGKKVHPTGAIPGGMNAPIPAADRARLRKDAQTMIDWAEEGVNLCLDFYQHNKELFSSFAVFDTGYMGSVGPNGELELYHGALRGIDAQGHIVFDQVPYDAYLSEIAEAVEDWSYMKFPFFRKLGYPQGCYRVGPLARFNVADSISTPRAMKFFDLFKRLAGGKPVGGSLFYHFTRLVEMLHATELIATLLADDEIESEDLVHRGALVREAIGIIEAPRGTLIHHYTIDGDGLLEKVNLIVATTQNNTGMNNAVRSIADEYIKAGKDISEGILNRIEAGIRCYDPCLSCATHAFGRMPLVVELVDAHGACIRRLQRD
jgi:NAD-reducing hydrogenase large subunit